MFHKAVLLGAALDAIVECQWPDESLHEEFASKSEDDDVETHEGEVAGAFAVVGNGFGVIVGVVGDEWVVGWQGVGEEYGIVERVGRARIEGVGGEEDYYKD